MKYIYSFVFILFGIITQAQPSFENDVYQDYIKSVVIAINGNIEAIPVMRLKSQDYMILNFDDLSNTEEDYHYKIIHCDKDWKKTDINEIDYIDGFNDEVIRVWEFSTLTEVEYTHFWIQLPNRDTRLKISGNYLIYVYQKNGDEEKPLFTRRFLVSEGVSSSFAKEVRATSGDRFRQQYDLTTNIPSFVSNAMSDISIEVIQNGHWNNSIKNVKTFSLNNNELKFDPFGSVSFNGLAEFRNFDTRILASPGRNVESVKLEYGKNIVNLYRDLNRSRTPYLFDFDFNGKYYVDARNSSRITTSRELDEDEASRAQFSYAAKLLDGEYTFLSKDIRADYAEVNFSVSSPEMKEDVYIYGAFTDWQLKPEFKMNYDFTEEAYFGKAMLKQGFYDYLYAIDGKDGIEFRPMEGSWYETENDYTVIVYFREFASRNDRVLSVYKYNTTNK